jgi:hypothetical protein
MKLHSQIPMWKKTIKETLNPKPTKIRYEIVDRFRTENPSNEKNFNSLEQKL